MIWRPLWNLAILGVLGGTSVLSRFLLLGGTSSILRTFWAEPVKKNTLYFGCSGDEWLHRNQQLEADLPCTPACPWGVTLVKILVPLSANNKILLTNKFLSGLQVHVWRQPGHCMVCSQLLLQVSFRKLALQDVCQKVSTYEPQWEKKVCAINNVISDVATLLQFFSFRTLTTAPQNSLRLFLMTREWYLQDRFVSCSDMHQSLEMFQLFPFRWRLTFSEGKKRA